MNRARKRPSRTRTLGRRLRFAARCKWLRDYARTTVLWAEFNTARRSLEAKQRAGRRL